MTNDFEDDHDTLDIDDDSSTESLDIGQEPMRVIYQLSTPSIQTLYERYKEGELVLAPDFQRHFVWNKQKASNLIESILLNIPLPLLFTAQFADKEEVVDGQQRLTSIFSFLDGSLPGGDAFRLSKRLKVMASQIGGKTFAELDRQYQREIKNRGLQVICISKDSQEDVKFEMFERLNTNITPLNAQELRNCLYRGPYNDFLRSMAEYEDYQFILNKPKFVLRMLDVENVLMFCTFYHSNPDRYSKSLTQNMNQDMRSHRNASADDLRELERQFKKSVKLVKHIWGERAFNIYSINAETKRGEYSKQFNQGLFQILMYWFTPYEAQHVIPFADLIREELLHLQVHNDGFKSILTGSGTNSSSNVRKKFDIWGTTIKGILEYPSNEPRAFSSKLKRSLWEADRTCQICKQEVVTPEDAEVDHITCYWRGGKTIPANARLTHRFCNRSRGGELR